MQERREKNARRGKEVAKRGGRVATSGDRRRQAGSGAEVQSCVFQGNVVEIGIGRN